MNHADADNRWAGDLEAAHLGGGRLEEWTHFELLVLGKPALNWHTELCLHRLANVQPSWRTRAGVQVLVGAADREVDAPIVKAQVDRTNRVAGIPNHKGSVLAAELGDSGDIRLRTGAVVNHLEGHQRDIIIEKWSKCFWGNQFAVGCDVHGTWAAGAVVVQRHEVQPKLLGYALQNEAVGGEVGRVDDHGLTTGSGLDRGHAGLIEVHRGGVLNQYLTSGGTEGHATEEVTRLLGLIDPV